MLFQLGQFKSAAGLDLDWKIECDALTEDDWACIAAVGTKCLPNFGGVVGVPTGGYPLEDAFKPYVTQGSKRILVVDDVWTTGKSMMTFVNDVVKGLHRGGGWWGFVAFARNPINRYNVMAFANISTQSWVDVS